MNRPSRSAGKKQEPLAPRIDRQDSQSLVLHLRARRGWGQERFAEEAGVDPKTIYHYEAGLTQPSTKILDRLIRAGGASVPLVKAVLLPAFRTIRTAIEGTDPAELESALAELNAGFAGLSHAAATDLGSEVLAARKNRPSLAPEARLPTERLCDVFLSCSQARQRLLIEKSRDFQSWALAERLCDESERAAADNATRALELVRLALKVARHNPEPVLRGRLLGYVGFFLGNAYRVAGFHKEAEAAFRHAWKLWRQEDAAKNELLAEWRLLDLEASFFRDRRRMEEALERHAGALSAAPREAQSSILLNKAFTLEQMGKAQEALATLDRAEPLLDRQHQPRLWFGLQFNRAVNLCHLDRYETAAALLPEIREVALALDNALDLIRVVWLSGRTAAGLGRIEEALAALEQVRREFRERKIAYDFALVSLELAVYQLQQGDTAAVKPLARELWWLFQAQGVHREALAALEVFRQAAEQEAASLELARRVLAYLRQAQHDAALRFDR